MSLSRFWTSRPFMWRHLNVKQDAARASLIARFPECHTVDIGLFYVKSQHAAHETGRNGVQPSFIVDQMDQACFTHA